MSQQSHFWGIYSEKTKMLIWKKYMHSNIHTSTIYNIQDMEAI